MMLSGHDGTQLAFQEVSGYVAPRWPEEEGGQQFHLDLTVDDLDRGEAGPRARRQAPRRGRARP